MPATEPSEQPVASKDPPGEAVRPSARVLPRIDRTMWSEWLVIVLVAFLYAGPTLLDWDPRRIQQSGEHEESSTLPILAEIGMLRYGEIPRWNPYMLTGFPHVGDFVNHFWHPVATLPVMLWGGIVGMKVSVFLAFLLAGLGQWLCAHVFGLRGLVRLWAALLFLLSGGLAFLWRAGWYELLLGAVWFPWCFAAVWWAVRRRDGTSVALAALSIAMVLTTGGGYYPFYLFGSLSVVVAMAVAFPEGAERGPRLRRAAAIALLSAGLVAVVILPWRDSYRYTRRDRPPERAQSGSQPIPYALFNYVVSQPEWFGSNALGKQGGFGWYYIGWVPLAALALAPLGLRERSIRPALATAAVLTLFLLAWHANRHTLFKHVYSALPFLYHLRFPGRLLIIATSPLLICGGFGLQHVYGTVRDWARSRRISVGAEIEGSRTGTLALPIAWIAAAPIVAVLLVSVNTAYKVNKPFAFSRPTPRLDPKSFAALGYLRRLDPGTYYVHMGGLGPEWSWTPAAYLLEMPILNFQYNRHLASQDDQRRPGSPFYAKAKYLLALPIHPKPPNARPIQTFQDWVLWRDPDALPFAFSIPATHLDSGRQVSSSDVTAVSGRIVGPNRVVVRAAGSRDRKLVVLVSDYPGWQLSVDGKPARAEPVNGYLGASLKDGLHTYTFEFRPRGYVAGIVVSLASLAAAAFLIVRESVARVRSPSRPAANPV
jgi:hypothetical protein